MAVRTHKAQLDRNATAWQGSQHAKYASTNPLASLVRFLRLTYTRYEVTFALNIMEPWERLIVNIFVLILAALVFMALMSAPAMLARVYGSAIYYLRGPVAVAHVGAIFSTSIAAAQGVIKDVVTATVANATTTILLHQ